MHYTRYLVYNIHYLILKVNAKILARLLREAFNISLNIVISNIHYTIFFLNFIYYQTQTGFRVCREIEYKIERLLYVITDNI